MLQKSNEERRKEMVDGRLKLNPEQIQESINAFFK